MVLIDWSCARPGDVAHVVAIVVCHADGAALMQTADRRAQRFFLEGNLPLDASHVSIVDAVVTRSDPLPCLRVAMGTRVQKIPPCHHSSLFQVTELCCGMGAFSSELQRAGFCVKLGVDQNPKWEGLFKSLHGKPAVEFLGESAGSSVTINKMMDMGLFHGTVLAGIACQPYSQMGDEAGMDDHRAGSLQEVLKTCWSAQCSVIVLECVPQVLKHEAFQATLKSYCYSTGYHLTQKVIDLKQTWCARRRRWFAVLTAQAIGPCELAEHPFDSTHQKISSVLPGLHQWTPAERKQLDLDLYELRNYEAYAVGGVSS